LGSVDYNYYKNAYKYDVRITKNALLELREFYQSSLFSQIEKQQNQIFIDPSECKLQISKIEEREPILSEEILAKNEFNFIDVLVSNFKKFPRKTNAFHPYKVKSVVPKKIYREVMNIIVNVDEIQTLAKIDRIDHFEIEKNGKTYYILKPRVVKIDKDRRTYNPYLKNQIALTSAYHSFDKVVKNFITINGKFGMIEKILTFPKNFSWKHIKNPEICFEILKDYIILLTEYLRKQLNIPKEKKIKLGMSAKLEIWSTERPYEVHFHFYILMISAIYVEGEGFIPLKKRGKRWYLNAKIIRKLWEKVLKKWGIKFRKGYVRLHNEKITPDNIPVILNWLRYQRKSWILDFYRFCEENPEWFPSKNWQFETIKTIHDFDLKNSVRSYGFWKFFPKNKIREFLEKFGEEEFIPEGKLQKIEPRKFSEEEEIAVWELEKQQIKLKGFMKIREYLDYISDLNKQVLKTLERLRSNKKS